MAELIRSLTAMQASSDPHGLTDDGIDTAWARQCGLPAIAPAAMTNCAIKADARGVPAAIMRGAIGLNPLASFYSYQRLLRNPSYTA